jgi:hypothetical protein
MKSRQSRRGSAGDLPPYRGPIRINSPDTDLYTIKTNLTLDDLVTSNASGVYVFNRKPSDVTSGNDWASLASTYSEYRVLAFEVHYLPRYNQTYNASVLPGTGCIATSHVTNTPSPSVFSDVTNYDTWRPAYSGRAFKMQWRARGTEELQWVPTATTNDAGSIIGVFGDLTASTLYGRLLTVFLVEFRGRR